MSQAGDMVCRVVQALSGAAAAVRASSQLQLCDARWDEQAVELMHDKKKPRSW